MTSCVLSFGVIVCTITDPRPSPAEAVSHMTTPFVATQPAEDSYTPSADYDQSWPFTVEQREQQKTHAPLAPPWNVTTYLPWRGRTISRQHNAAHKKEQR